MPALSSQRHVLIIDDDVALGRLIQEYLTLFQIKVTCAEKPSQGLQLLRSHHFDALVLDLMLPEQDGLSVCREVRNESAIPILMLSARGEVSDRVVGLEMGADDYLPKPFEPRELAARIQSLIRRQEKSIGPTRKSSIHRFRSGQLIIDADQHTAQLQGQDLELSSLEFEMLMFFLNHGGKVLTRDEILDQMRGIEFEAFNRSVDVAVSRLRQKLNDDPKHPRYIKTVWGTGYLWMPEVEVHD